MTIGDLATEARSLVDADSTTYTNADVLRRLNAAYEEIVGDILGMDGKWQFDDTRYTDFPIATTTLVVGQNDYTFDITHLEIEGVSVLDNSSIWHKLTPIDDMDDIGIDPAEFLKDDGMPIYYDKQGRSLILYPAPASGRVTLAAGLKVFFKRTASTFTSAELTTGTAIPGFASPYHIILAYKTALPYAQTYKRDRVAFILNEINRLNEGIKKHYGRREQDRRKQMSMAGIHHR